MFKPTVFSAEEFRAFEEQVLLTPAPAAAVEALRRGVVLASVLRSFGHCRLRLYPKVVRLEEQ